MSSLERSSAESERGRDIPSFIEARPPLITAPWLRPKPAHGTNLMDLYEDESMELEADCDLVQVYLRVKPSSEPNTLYDIRSDQELVTTADVLPSDYSRRTQCQISKQHTFSHIFRADSTQSQIFDHVVKGNLKKLPDGHSYTLLTYGASGSGKTYTLMGTEEQPGLVPRSLEYLFKLLSPAQHPLFRPRDGSHEQLTSAQQAHELELVSRLRRPTPPVRGARRLYRRMSQRLSGDFHSTGGLAARHTHYVWVSFVEIYNEAVYDLLQRTDRSKVAAKLKIYEDPGGTVYVKGATQAFVRTGAEAYDVMSAGRLNLRVAATGVHAHSSRSHCIFTITLLTDTSEGVQSSCVRLCDLAGSERAERTQNAGVRMAESRAINSSLHVLERCLHMLRRKQRAANTTDAMANFLVPFRESKLTRLLGAPLSGASREAVSMVVTVNTSPLYAQETRHVLQLAAIASNIYVNQSSVEDVGLESTAERSTDSQRDTELLSLRADNERLRFEIERLYSRLEEADRTAANSRERSAMTMRELVEEARDASHHYYTQQMSLQDERHRREKERLLKNVDTLVAENTRLKEQLAARPLELAVVESELEHLHACIAERDRDRAETNTDESPPEPVVVLDSESETDSESDSDSRLGRITEESSIASARTTSECGRDAPTYPHVTRSDITKDSVDRKTTECLTDDSENDYNTDDSENEIQIRLPFKKSSAQSTSNCSVKSERKSVIGSDPCTDTMFIIPQKDTDRLSELEKITVANGQPIKAHIFSVDTAKFEDKIKESISINTDVEHEHSGVTPMAINSNNTSITLDNGEVRVDSANVDSQTKHSVSFESFEENKNDCSDVNLTTTETHNDKSFSASMLAISKMDKKTEHSSSAGTSDNSGQSNELNCSGCINGTVNKFNMNNENNIKEKPIEHSSSDQNMIFPKLENNLHSISLDRLSVSVPERKSEIFEKAKCAYINDQKSNDCGILSCEGNTPNDKYLSQDNPIVRPDIIDTLYQASHQTLDSFSLPNIMNEDPKTNGVPVVKANLFNNAVEIVLKEQNTFFETSNHTQMELVETFKSFDDINDRSSKVMPKQTMSSKSSLDTSSTCSMAIGLIPDVLLEKSTNKTLEADGIMSMCRPKSELWLNSTIDKSILDIGLATKVKKENYIRENQSENHNEHFCGSLNAGTLNDDCPSLVDVKPTELTSVASTDKPENFRISNKEQEHESRNELDSQSSESNKAAFFDEENLVDDKTEKESFNFLFESQPVSCSLNDDIKSIIGSINFNKNNDKKANDNGPTDEIVNVVQVVEDLNLNRKHKERRKILRLRKKSVCTNNIKEDEKTDNPTTNEQRSSCKYNDKKLKDIANLQQEFSDVTLGIPSNKKEVRDLTSPEEPQGEENVPPSAARSCPAKSACSRRKLYTPRAEPLEESMASDDDGNLRVRIPRPSYHRVTRARRKL